MGIIRKLFKNEVKIYKSIDELPIYNWWKVHKDNSLLWLLHDPKQHISGVQEQQLTEVWASIYKEFINTFGISKAFREVLNVKREIQIYKYRMYLEKDETLQIFIDIAQDKLEELLKSGGKSEVNKEKVYVEKYLGRHVDDKTITVKEYYTYLKVLEEELTLKRKQANER